MVKTISLLVQPVTFILQMSLMESSLVVLMETQLTSAFCIPEGKVTPFSVNQYPVVAGVNETCNNVHSPQQ